MNGDFSRFRVLNGFLEHLHVFMAVKGIGRNLERYAALANHLPNENIDRRRHVHPQFGEEFVSLFFQVD